MSDIILVGNFDRFCYIRVSVIHIWVSLIAITTSVIDITTYGSVWFILPHTGQYVWYYHMQISLFDITLYGSVGLILLNTDQFQWFCYIWVSLTDIADSQTYLMYQYQSNCPVCGNISQPNPFVAILVKLTRMRQYHSNWPVGSNISQTNW